jgi:hypothetical protein
VYVCVCVYAYNKRIRICAHTHTHAKINKCTHAHTHAHAHTHTHTHTHMEKDSQRNIMCIHAFISVIFRYDYAIDAGTQRKVLLHCVFERAWKCAYTGPLAICPEDLRRSFLRRHVRELSRLSYSVCPWEHFLVSIELVPYSVCPWEHFLVSIELVPSLKTPHITIVYWSRCRTASLNQRLKKNWDCHKNSKNASSQFPVLKFHVQHFFSTACTQRLRHCVCLCVCLCVRLFVCLCVSICASVCVWSSTAQAWCVSHAMTVTHRRCPACARKNMVTCDCHIYTHIRTEIDR